MPRRLPEPPFELGSLIPEFAPLARETTLLYPRAGSPGVRESSLGGPLLWPAGEPWPYCARPGHQTYDPVTYRDLTPGPVPMVPVVQLFARDVPRLAFPDGSDLLQLVWCPLLHAEEDTPAALPGLYWRRESEVVAAGLLRDVPAPGEGEYHDDFTPRPCTVSPTAVVEYPNWDLPKEFSDALGPRLGEIEERFGLWYTEFACALQSKVGGYPAWTQPPDWPHCAAGHRMEHLLSVAGEPAYGRWLPLDEHRPGVTAPALWESPADDAVMDAIGPDMVMGDCGGVYVFLCRQCPGLPYAHRYDCH
ncbi:hypothetical protein [Streptomyces sp. NPDC026673]|uniref:hypothetical protein n=1 Tax=Streptomyces sp. NPDC026673 TaxID=3155724 RepID=UPI0033E1FFA0